MKKFIISFLAIISFIFADANETNGTQILENLKKDENKSEIANLIAEKIEQNKEENFGEYEITLYSVITDIKKLNLQYLTSFLSPSLVKKSMKPISKNI